MFLARQRGELVVIFGDYDVDGVTSTALLLEVLRGLGWNVDHYLPHRMDEGYGLSGEAVQNCLSKKPAKLLLAVDCGSSATMVIDELRSIQVDVIVLDHHQISNPPPPALALVNPRSEVGAPPGSSGPTQNGSHLGDFRELCSVGLAFKFAH